MALSKLVFKPGVNRDQTNYSSEGGWFDMDKVRFRSGFPEKIGGWVVQNFSAYIGTARALYAYTASDGSQIIAIGTNEKIYILFGTAIYDITPIRNPSNLTPIHTFISPTSNNCIETVNTEAKIIVNINGHGCSVGDWVTLSGVVGTGSPQKINNIPITEINGEHKITAVTANSFTFTTTTAANATSAGNGGTAIDVDCQINVGYPIVTAGYGWGTGTWGRGTWGSSGTPGILQPVRLQSFQNFNNDLIFNVRGGDIYYWTFDPVLPSVSLSTRAETLYDKFPLTAVAVPEQVSEILFASTGHLFALGCTNYDAAGSEPEYLGTYDPLLVRWANVDPDIGPEPENWQPTQINTSGFFRLQSGSRIITAINTRQEMLVWTNVALYSIQYLGTDEIFGQQQMSAHVSIMGPNTVVGANNVTYWMGNDKFYTYTGRVETLPCTLRQYIFENINRTQADIFFAGSNAQFNEIVWFYATANSSEIDRYVIYNYSENIWYFGTLERTTWIDTGNTFFPLATANGWVYQHENGTDDGQPNGEAPLGIDSYIQSADIDISDGDNFMLLKRVIPDVNFNGSLSANPVTGDPITPEATVSIGVRNFPGAQIATTNASGVATNEPVVTEATVDLYTNQVFIRARGRQLNFKISSSGVGTQWQLGMPRIDARPDGRRG
jgi:hypothetical protein